MKLHNLTMSAAVAALIAGSAMAQEAADPMATDTMSTDTMAAEAPAAPVFTSIDEMSVGDVIGKVAYDPEGNTIGEVDYVVADGDEGSAVLGIGGFLGLGEYTVALPLSDFELAEDGASFTLQTDKETLKAQPEFDESDVESLPDDTPIASLLPQEEPEAGEAAPANDKNSEAVPEATGDAPDEDAAEAPAMEEETDDAVDQSLLDDEEKESSTVTQ